MPEDADRQDIPVEIPPESTAADAPEAESVVRLSKSGPRASGRPMRADDHRTYRSLLLGLYDGVFVTKLDGTIMDVNQRALDLFGYDREALEGQNVKAVFASFPAGLIERIREHLASGRFTVLDAYGRRSDGSTFPTETAVGRINISLSGELVFSVRNVARRHETQERLRTEHNALMNSASSIAIADLSAGIQFGNPAFLKMWHFETLDQVRGTDIRDLWQDSHLASALLDQPLAGKTWFGELAAKAADGSVFYVQATAAPNRDTRERIVGVVYSFIDVTDRKRAEETIRKEAQAQLRVAREKTSFQGMLNVVSLADVIQLIHSTQKTGTLYVRDAMKRLVGRATFQRGQIINALRGNVSGEEAVYALQTADGSEFSFDPTVTDAEQSIRTSTMTLLLEGAKRLDESRGVREQI